ncbi:MAG: hypothetical protein JSS31_16420 [Proteobacteria bacterium]|nr:hypothetical protein [Pseudomonadota bacterium]MBS0495492.1 hypothetical protein [Pseudomonadota bacterium]
MRCVLALSVPVLVALLADLPPIPPSFDEPANGVAPEPPIEPEGTP